MGPPQEFFAGTATTTVAVPASAAPTAGRPRRGPLIAMTVAAVAGCLVWVLLAWPSPTPARPDLTLPRLEGRQVGLQLPLPVARGDCVGALRAFPGITAPAARDAFVTACLGAHGPAPAPDASLLTGSG